MTIAMINADNQGNKLFIKELRSEGDRYFVKYKSTYNDMPFTETEIYPVDGGENMVICGGDGTVIWKFSTGWLETI